MNPKTNEITLTIGAIDAGLSAARGKELSDVSENEAEWAGGRRDKLMRYLWQNGLRPDVPLTLAHIAVAVDMEFAFWCLGLPGARGEADKFGRLMAILMVGPPLILLDSNALTGGAVNQDRLNDLLVDVIHARRPLAEWHGWLMDAVMRTQEEFRGTWDGRANLAVNWCAMSLITPSEICRIEGIPKPNQIAGLGRRCALHAWRFAIYGYVTANPAFQAAHELRDMAMVRASAKLRRALDARLSELEADLFLEAEKAVNESAVAGYKRLSERPELSGVGGSVK